MDGIKLYIFHLLMTKMANSYNKIVLGIGVLTFNMWDENALVWLLKVKVSNFIFGVQGGVRVAKNKCWMFKCSGYRGNNVWKKKKT